MQQVLFQTHLALAIFRNGAHRDNYKAGAGFVEL